MISDIKLSQPVLRMLITAAANKCSPDGSYVSLGVYIDASEKSIYKWANGTSKPDCDHIFAMLAIAGWLDDEIKERLR
jgi:hypothetical protein